MTTPTALALALVLTQGGYTKETFPELGLEFPRARHYEQVPLQPGEVLRVLSFREEERITEREERRVPPSFWIVRIDGPHDHDDDEDTPPIDGIEPFFEQAMKRWTASGPHRGRERDGYVGSYYELEGETRSILRGWAYCYERTEPTPRTWALIGWCDERDLEEQSKIWLHTAEHMRFDEPRSADLEKLERHYARRDLRDPEHRIRVRSALVKGWDAEDTDNYILVFDTPDQPLVRRVAREIEAIREEYLALFPPAGDLQAVSTVRICESQDEYHAYGGRRGTAGYWNSAGKELVLYDAAVQDGARSIDTDTFITLYHEAFHQYIHYSVGELAPHPWFNEGYGDYFSGARISGGKVVRIGINPWRLRPIQHYLRAQREVPWSKIIHYEQAEFYASAAVCYAQAWSMIYFLRNSKEVEHHPVWSRILDTYFETLKLEWQLELRRMKARGDEPGEAVLEDASAFARKQALNKAFADVDLDRIEHAWRQFVLELDD